MTRKRSGVAEDTGETGQPEGADEAARVDESRRPWIVVDEARATHLKVLAYQSLDIRPAFFGLNRALRDELRARQRRLPELRALDVPVTIVFGADDPFLNAEVAREFHGILPNSELHLVADAGHYVQLDQPAAVAAPILRN